MTDQDNSDIEWVTENISHNGRDYTYNFCPADPTRGNEGTLVAFGYLEDIESQERFSAEAKWPVFDAPSRQQRRITVLNEIIEYMEASQ